MDTPVVEYTGLSVDLIHRQLRIEGKPYPLSQKEFILVYQLLQRKGALVSRADLCNSIGATEADSALENHIYRLRKKLGGYGHLIKSKRRHGYRLDAIQ